MTKVTQNHSCIRVLVKKSLTSLSVIEVAIELYFTVTPLVEQTSKKYSLIFGVLMITPFMLRIYPLCVIVRVHSSLITIKFGNLSNVKPKYKKGLSKPCRAFSIETSLILSSFLKNLE